MTSNVARMPTCVVRGQTGPGPEHRALHRAILVSTEVLVVAISIRLTPEDEARLADLARRTGRSKTFYVREAIHEHLDDLEERFWADSLVREWEDSNKHSRPASALWDELGV